MTRLTRFVIVACACGLLLSARNIVTAQAPIPIRPAADKGGSQACAAAEPLLSVVFFAAVVAYARLTRASA